MNDLYFLQSIATVQIRNDNTQINDAVNFVRDLVLENKNWLFGYNNKATWRNDVIYSL
jgi:hypothetical protein